MHLTRTGQVDPLSMIGEVPSLRPSTYCPNESYALSWSNDDYDDCDYDDYYDYYDYGLLFQQVDFSFASIDADQ